MAAGALAELWLRTHVGIETVAWVSSVGPVTLAEPTPAILERLQRLDVDASPVRCPDADTSARMADAIAAARDAQDSVGGVVSCVCRNVPPGLGEPVFDKLHAVLAQAMLSLPAAKGGCVGVLAGIPSG